MEHTIKLHNTGRWTDDVGGRMEKTAMDSVRYFNQASLAVWQKIETLASYSINDVQYESQPSKLMEMRVEFNG